MDGILLLLFLFSARKRVNQSQPPRGKNVGNKTTSTAETDKRIVCDSKRAERWLTDEMQMKEKPNRTARGQKQSAADELGRFGTDCPETPHETKPSQRHVKTRSQPAVINPQPFLLHSMTFNLNISHFHSAFWWRTEGLVTESEAEHESRERTGKKFHLDGQGKTRRRELKVEKSRSNAQDERAAR